MTLGYEESTNLKQFDRTVQARFDCLKIILVDTLLEKTPTWIELAQFIAFCSDALECPI